MSERIEIRLAGTGGQGMILAGIVLADAAIRDGKQVVQTQSYGPEARGGASRAEIIIADGPIHYPKVLDADILLCMSQVACDRYGMMMRRGGLLIVDNNQVSRTPTAYAVQAPITQLAREKTGREITANVVALGVLVGLTGVVSRSSLEAAVRARAPKGTKDMNLEALAAGFEAAQELMQE
ncbi:MAG: 2-oxoacid:acceptor oxidoreductase family protein [Anaerolineae bacterium]|nr:2-oxoacid:acceptor oxidoreductase family protein [Anaerolineae bacterium]